MNVPVKYCLFLIGPFLLLAIEVGSYNLVFVNKFLAIIGTYIIIESIITQGQKSKIFRIIANQNLNFALILSGILIVTHVFISLILFSIKPDYKALILNHPKSIISGAISLGISGAYSIFRFSKVDPLSKKFFYRIKSINLILIVIHIVMIEKDTWIDKVNTYNQLIPTASFALLFCLLLHYVRPR